MTTEPEAGARQQADSVYLKPAAAEDVARKVLDRDDATDAERSEALATLGRSAYYDNRVSDAIAHLERALSLATTPSATADISLTLAPALSKIGRPADALELLRLDVDELSDEQRGKLENQRGIIHVETGELPQALDAFARARDIHRGAGDRASEARVLVNMAAAASELGRLADAEAWYAHAWRLSRDTGQEFSSAIIEGNLGYVASRRGDFSAALEWYQRARTSFGELGDVDLLVAVLETDHASTLLDLGLDTAAQEAAEYARASSIGGSNRMLEIQSLLLLGEARLRLGQFTRAEESLAAAHDAARELDVPPLQLRSDYLTQRLRLLDGRFAVDTHSARELAEGLRSAGWHREALRTLVLSAQAALEAGDHDTASDLLAARGAAPLQGVDAFDVAHADAIEALVAADDAALVEALNAGARELERERLLVDSAELETRLGHRLRDLRELTVRHAVASNDPPQVVGALDRVGRSHALVVRVTRQIRELRSQLRDVRVGIQEAQVAAGGAEELRARSSHLEQEILAVAGAQNESDAEQLDDLVTRQTPLGVAFFTQRDRLHAVTTGPDPRLFDLGPIEGVQRAVRAQRAGLRRMASGDGRALDLTEAASGFLSRLLVEPLELLRGRPVAIVTDTALAGLSWSGVDGLVDREFFLAASIRSALATTDPIDVSSIGLINAGELTFADSEIESIGSMWQGVPCSIRRRALLADAHGLFRSTDLVHIAAHGSFLTDNPFVSAIHLSDGDLRVLDLERHERLPGVVVLASCDSGAATGVGTELVGTAGALCSIGVRAVFASAVIVDDGAAARLAVDVHGELVGGAGLAQALQRARTRARDRDTPEDRSAAASFVLYGDGASMHPLRVTGA